MTPAAMDELGARLNGAVGRLSFAWLIEDDQMTLSELVRHGKTAMTQVANRYEFVLFEDDWTVDGSFLRVDAVAVWWPNGPVGKVDLFDDTPSDVPA